MRFNFGRRFNLPRIGKKNKYADSSEKITGDFELFPKIPEEEHPLPFYMTPKVTLPAFPDPPWKEDVEREEREKFQEICQDPKFIRTLRNEFLKEALDEEIIALASLLITESKMKDAKDKEMIIYAETEIFHPVIQREVLVCVWELLYEWGREMSAEEFKEMHKREKQLWMSSKSKELLTAHMLEGLAWSEHLSEEKQLSGERWEVLLYNYRAKLQQNSFKRNIALHMAQERIVSQIAAEEVMKKGVLTLLEKDMVTLDEKEKMKMPPREG